MGFEFESLVLHDILRETMEMKNLLDQEISSLLGSEFCERNKVGSLGKTINYDGDGAIVV